MKIFEGKDGNFCAAKTSYLVSFAIVAVKYALAGTILSEFDSGGAAAFMGIAAGIYYGRANTKAGK